MGNYFDVLHPADHAGGRPSREYDGHGTTMYIDEEAEAMIECALQDMRDKCAAMERAIQQHARNNEIGQAAEIDILHRANAINAALLRLIVDVDYSQINRLTA